VNGEVTQKDRARKESNVAEDGGASEERLRTESPVPSICMEHSYSLPPERDPASAHPKKRSRDEAFNHDHG